MHEKMFGEKFPAGNFNVAKKIAAKISCGENSGDEIFKWRNWTRRYHAPKFKAAKFPAVKFPVEISRCGISCSEVSGSKIDRGETPIILVKLLEKH